MPNPSEFYLRVVHGIVGGFAPPTPTDVKTVAFSGESDTLQITTSSDLGPSLVKKEKIPDIDALILELKSILKTIPTEDPKGSEDIYGMNTGIFWGSDEFVWENAGAQGCGGFSTVKATDEDKEKFKRAVEIAEGLVAKGVSS